MCGDLLLLERHLWCGYMCVCVCCVLCVCVLCVFCMFLQCFALPYWSFSRAHHTFTHYTHIYAHMNAHTHIYAHTYSGYRCITAATLLVCIRKLRTVSVFCAHTPVTCASIHFTIVPLTTHQITDNSTYIITRTRTLCDRENISHCVSERFRA